MREGPPGWLGSRGTQRIAALATESGYVKRGGRGSEGPPGCSGAYHEEAEAHEGWVGRQSLTVAWRRGSTLARTKALKTANGAARNFLGHRQHALLAPPPRTEDAQPAGGTSGGQAGDDESPGLRERSKSLKGESQERHLSENGRTAKGRGSR